MKTELNVEHVTLSAIGYNVYVLNDQVVFEESSPIWSCYTKLIFERRNEINNSPGIWYFVGMKVDRNGGVVASHIVKACEWLNENMGKSFEPYKGKLSHLNKIKVT